MGGRPLAASDRLRINGDVMQIVGVTPPAFTGLAVGERFDVVIPLCLPRGGEQELRREFFEVSVVGRLRPGWTIERATAHVDALSTGLFEATVPAGYGEQGTQLYKSYRLEAASMASGVGQLRDRYDTRALAAARHDRAGAAHGQRQSRQPAAGARRRPRRRGGDPAGPRRIAARARAPVPGRVRAARRDRRGARRRARAGPQPGPDLGALYDRGRRRSLTLHLDWNVLGFTAAVAAATCLLFGLAPIVARQPHPGERRARHARRVSRIAAAPPSSAGSSSAQTALSLVLVIGALLFVRSFHRLMTFDPGIRRDGITVAMLGYQTANIPKEQLSATQRELVAAVKTVPGVIDAATTTHIPLIGGTWGHGVTARRVKNGAYFSWVGPALLRHDGHPADRGPRPRARRHARTRRGSRSSTRRSRASLHRRRQPDRPDASHAAPSPTTPRPTT